MTSTGSKSMGYVTKFRKQAGVGGRWNAGTVAVLVSVLLAHADRVDARATGITGYSGKQDFSCDFCHGGGAVPLAQFVGPQEVVAGAVATFRFLVRSQSPELFEAGFNVAASTGTLEALPGYSVRAADGELTQSSPQALFGGEASWDFTWRAPSRPGPQLLYGAGLATDAKDSKGGDGTATTTFVVTVTEGAPCVGDCDDDDVVEVNELVQGLNIALGSALVDRCAAFDPNNSDDVAIDELVAGVNNAMHGCAPEPTPVPSGPPGLCPESTATSSPGGAAPTTSPTPTGTPTGSPGTGPEVEWTTYGASHLRTFFNPNESRITRQNVGTLRTKWRYQTGAIVTASPSVAYVDVPGEGRVKVVFAASWDGNFYALRASNGTRLWHFQMKPHPGATFVRASSAEIATVAGEQRVYVGGGMTMYCLEAATGERRWEFDVGTGCTTCDGQTERNEIESSPAVVGDVVYFGMDVNDSAPGKGGAFAVSAVDGRLIWYFDVVTRQTCRPDASDIVKKFDGFHTAAQLDLEEDFFATRPGCNFDRTEVACGNIWSSFAVDPVRRMIFTASSNCDTDDDPTTPEPLPPMTPYDEAIFALTFDGDPVWAWRPREVDNADLAFGGVPNLFEVDIQGVKREVVGVGNKDGTYYLLDRDGVNEITGGIEPYWQTRVVEGGAIGGIIASAAVGGGKVFFSTAVGWSLAAPQRPAAWGLMATDGVSLWWNCSALPSFAPTTAIPGVAFMGSLTGSLFAYDGATGEQLFQSPSLGGPVASGAAIVDGEVVIGAGIGARGGYEGDVAYLQSLIPSPITAFCLPDASDCPAEVCDDKDPCTYDFHATDGCRSEPAPDGIPCRVGSQAGSCASGLCRVGANARTRGY